MCHHLYNRDILHAVKAFDIIKQSDTHRVFMKCFLLCMSILLSELFTAALTYLKIDVERTQSVCQVSQRDKASNHPPVWQFLFSKVHKERFCAAVSYFLVPSVFTDWSLWSSPESSLSGDFDRDEVQTYYLRSLLLVTCIKLSIPLSLTIFPQGLLIS